MKTVLIALDYDPTAQKVAETGFSLAKTLGAKVLLLQVISDPVPYSSSGKSPLIGFPNYMDMGTFQLDNVDGLINASQNFLDKSKQQLGDEAIQTMVIEGDTAESIIEVGEGMQADIIVMGSHSRNWIGNIVTGSVTEQILHHTSIPLFIVPTKKHNLLN